MPTQFSYTVPDAARLLGIGKTKLYELISAGEIAVVKIGSRTVVPHDELSTFINRRKAA